MGTITKESDQMKNKTVLLSILTLLFGFQKLLGQNYLNYYQTINDAEIAHLDGNFQISDSLYRVSFNLVNKPFKEDYLLAAKNSEMLRDSERTYEYLRKAIANGLTFKRMKKQLSIFKKSNRWKIIKKEYDSLHNDYLKTLNIQLRSEIAEMVKNDQKARTPIFGSWRKMRKIDSYNYNRLLEIIKQNNDKWPGFSVIGEITPRGKYDVTKNITLLPLHFRKEWIVQLKPYMLEAVLHGDMYPYQYARIIDYRIGSEEQENIVYKENNRVKISDRCNLYGTYLNVKVCDCEIAEIERKKIGFEPLEDYYRKVKGNYECLGNR